MSTDLVDLGVEVFTWAVDLATSPRKRLPFTIAQSYSLHTRSWERNMCEFVKLFWIHNDNGSNDNDTTGKVVSFVHYQNSKTLTGSAKYCMIYFRLDPANVSEMCYKNSIIAGSVGRQDLVQIWTLAAFIATPSSQGVDLEDDVPWAHHPFSRSQIEYLWVSV